MTQSQPPTNQQKPVTLTDKTRLNFQFKFFWWIITGAFFIGSLVAYAGFQINNNTLMITTHITEENKEWEGLEVKLKTKADNEDVTEIKNLIKENREDIKSLLQKVSVDPNLMKKLQSSLALF